MGYAPFSDGYIQIGTESIAGTPVACTSLWPGETAGIMDIRTRKRQRMNIGRSYPFFRQYDSYLGGRLTVPRSPANFEHTLFHVLEAGVKAATAGAGPDFSRTYDLPVTNSVNTIKTKTLEAGNAFKTSEQYRMAHGFVESFELSGSAGPDGDAWMIAPIFRGAAKLPSVLTADLFNAYTPPTDLIFSATDLYIDDSGDSIGASQLDGVMLDASLKFNTGIIPVPAANGKNYYTQTKWASKPDMITVDMTFELEDVADVVATERAAWEDDAIRLVRLHMPGPTSALDLLVDMALKWTGVGDYIDSNGNTCIKFTGSCLQSPDDNLFWTAVLVNSIETPV